MAGFRAAALLCALLSLLFVAGVICAKQEEQALSKDSTSLASGNNRGHGHGNGHDQQSYGNHAYGEHEQYDDNVVVIVDGDNGYGQPHESSYEYGDDDDGYAGERYGRRRKHGKHGRKHGHHGREHGNRGGYYRSFRGTKPLEDNHDDAYGEDKDGYDGYYQKHDDGHDADDDDDNKDGYPTEGFYNKDDDDHDDDDGKDGESDDYGKSVYSNDGFFGKGDDDHEDADDKGDDNDSKDGYYKNGLIKDDDDEHDDGDSKDGDDDGDKYGNDGFYNKGGDDDHDDDDKGDAKDGPDGDYKGDDKDGDDGKHDKGHSKYAKDLKLYSKENDGDKFLQYEHGDDSKIFKDYVYFGKYFRNFDTKEYERNKKNDAKLLQVALNLEFLEAEFFLHATTGFGLDKVAPYLVKGGPKPKGGSKAQLDKLTYDIVKQFALQEVGHLRAIKKTLGKYYFPRPRLDISRRVFADLVDKAFGKKLRPRFDVYASPINFFIGVYAIPYVGLTGYVGASPDLLTPRYRRLVAGLLGVEAGQDAVTRQYLYQRRHKIVKPYGYTVAKFTDKISKLRNVLSRDGILDEGLKVPKFLGAEKLVYGNVLAGNKDSLSYARKPWQVFSTVYGTGNASYPGGFYPHGARGKIAKLFLKKSYGYGSHNDYDYDQYDGDEDDAKDGAYDGADNDYYSKKDNDYGYYGKKDNGNDYFKKGGDDDGGDADGYRDYVTEGDRDRDDNGYFGGGDNGGDDESYGKDNGYGYFKKGDGNYGKKDINIGNGYLKKGAGDDGDDDDLYGKEDNDNFYYGKKDNGDGYFKKGGDGDDDFYGKEDNDNGYFNKGAGDDGDDDDFYGKEDNDDGYLPKKGGGFYGKTDYGNDYFKKGAGDDGGDDDSFGNLRDHGYGYSPKKGDGFYGKKDNGKHEDDDDDDEAYSKNKGDYYGKQDGDDDDDSYGKDDDGYDGKKDDGDYDGYSFKNLNGYSYDDKDGYSFSDGYGSSKKDGFDGKDL